MSQVVIEAEIDPKGYYSAANNQPPLRDGVGKQGDFYISSDTGTVDFGHGPVNIKEDELVLLSRGLIWKVVPTVSDAATGVTIGTLDSSTPKSANGAVVQDSNRLIMQTADNVYPGLVSTTTQIMRGQKIMPEGLVANVTGVASGNAVTQGLTQYSVTAMGTSNNLVGIKPNADITQVLCSNGVNAYPEFRNLTTKDFFPNGQIIAKSMTLTGAPSGDTLSVTGTTALLGNVTAPTATVSGQATLGSLVVNNNATTASLNVTGNTTIGGNLSVTGTIAFDNLSVVGLVSADRVTADTSMATPLITTATATVSGTTTTNNLTVSTTATATNLNVTTQATVANLAVNTKADVPTLATPIDPLIYTGSEAINLATLSGIAETGGANFGLYAKLLSPVFTGNPTAPTPADGDFSNSIATTKYVGGTYDFAEGYMIYPTGFCIQWGKNKVDVPLSSTVTVDLPIKLSQGFAVVTTQDNGSDTTIGAKFNGLNKIDLQNISTSDVIGCNYVALGFFQL